MKSISDNITTKLESQGIIQKEDVDKCKYGLEVMLSSLFEILSILIFSVFIGNFLETVLLFASFIPLRIYAGGYHANTKLKCYLISVAVYIIFTLVLYILPRELYLWINVICAVFSITMVIKFAPIVHHNKSVNDIERKYYRKFSIIIVLMETMIILIATAIVPFDKIGISLSLGQFSVSISMLMAIVEQWLYNK